MLEKLSHVQRYDLELDAIKQEKAQTPTSLLEAQQEYHDLEVRLSNVSTKFQDISKQISANQLEIDALEQRRKEADEASLRSSTPKEASQFRNQEMQFQTRKDDLEEETFPLMEEQDRLEGHVTNLKEQLQELAPQLEQLQHAETTRVTALEAKANEIAGQRDALTRELDKMLLKQYEQIRKSKRGLGLVAVQGGARCGGCNMKLPIHVLQKVMKASGMTRCPSCGRILWMEPVPITP